MTPVRSLARKLALIGSAVLALALGSIGLTLWVSWQLEGGAAAVNEAGRLRMLTWQLAATAPVPEHAAPSLAAPSFGATAQQPTATAHPRPGEVRRSSGHRHDRKCHDRGP